MGAAAGLTVIRLLIAAAWRDQVMLCNNDKGMASVLCEAPPASLSAPITSAYTAQEHPFNPSGAAVVQLAASCYSQSSQAHRIIKELGADRGHSDRQVKVN